MLVKYKKNVKEVYKK